MGISWDVVRHGDATPRDSADWRNLMRLARESSAGVERGLAATPGRVLLVHPCGAAPPAIRSSLRPLGGNWISANTGWRAGFRT